MKTRCPQCHTDGHHKMSCTDESNPARKDRVTVPTSLKEPIVEGAYYEREDGSFGAAVVSGDWHEVCGDGYYDDGEPHDSISPRLTRRVYLVPVDPAEVVAELRGLQLSAHRDSHSEFGGRTDEAREEAFCEAADLVAEKLGVES